MENRRTINSRLIIGGILIGAFFFGFFLSPNSLANLAGLIGVRIKKEANQGDATKKMVSSKNVTNDTNVSLLSPLLSPSPLLSAQQATTPAAQVAVDPMPVPSPTANITKITTKRSGRIVINEIAWAGTKASAADEWLELYNADNYDVDISGWRVFSDDKSPDITFPEGAAIGGNSYFLIERTDDNTVKTVNADLVASFGQGGLNDSGENLYLADSDGSVVDAVSAGNGWYAGDLSQKLSMERIDPLRAGDVSENWKSFSGIAFATDAGGNMISGTPKARNSEFATSPSPTPTPTPNPSSMPSPLATPSPSPSLTPTPSASPITSNLPSPPLLEVVINEIAWMGTATSSNDEWMELRNNTSNSINLTGWTIKADNWANTVNLSGTIEPSGFYILERGPNHVFSDVITDMTYGGALVLNNGGGSLTLKNADMLEEDHVDGSSGWPAGCSAISKASALTACKSGEPYRTMERINSELSGDDALNWVTNDGIHRNGHDIAGNPINGTPKAETGI